MTRPHVLKCRPETSTQDIWNISYLKRKLNPPNNEKKICGYWKMVKMLNHNDFVIACHLKQMKWRKRKSGFSKVVYLTMIFTLRVAQSWYTSILLIIFKLDFCCSVILCDGAITWFIHQYSNTLSWYICTMWIIDYSAIILKFFW